jgi:hypothetical protein
MIIVYYMHAWKYHDEAPHIVQLVCANKKEIWTVKVILIRSQMEMRSKVLEIVVKAILVIL